MPLTLAVTVAGLAFTLGPRSSHPRLALLAGYLACAAGLLFKGPIGVVLPAAIVVAVRFAEGTWPAIWELTAWRRLLTELDVVRGVLVVLVISRAGLCLDAVRFRRRVRPRVLLASQRATRPGRVAFAPPSVRWMYGVYFMLYFLPASPVVLAAMLHRRAWRDDVPGEVWDWPGCSVSPSCCRRHASSAGRTTCYQPIPVRPSSSVVSSNGGSPGGTAAECWLAWSAWPRRCSSAGACTWGGVCRRRSRIATTGGSPRSSAPKGAGTAGDRLFPHRAARDFRVGRPLTHS